MKTVDAKLIVCCPGRNFATVEITTEDNVYGLGDATLNGRELGASDLSPVCMAALHFDLSIHNFGIQEYMPHTDETDAIFPHSYSFENGFMHPGEAPGLGVDLEEKLAAGYPYQPAYLPVNRKLGGTMHSW